jgi:uncharacterized protein (TIGR02145 family)
MDRPLLILVIAGLVTASACSDSFISSTIKVATDEASDITYNSAVLHGRLLSKGMAVGRNGRQCTYRFVISDNDQDWYSAENFDVQATSDDGESFSVDVGPYLAASFDEGLAMGAEYYYRAYVSMNGGSFASFGEVRKFRTDVLPVEVSAGVTDLGLSVNWGGCNLGAASPEDYGEYYAWAEVEPKEKYSEDTYRYILQGEGANYPFSYKVEGSFYSSCDAVRARLGDQWRTPTKAEWQELVDNCEWIRAQRNGVYGFLVRSRKEGLEDRGIFLPSAGCKRDETVGNLNSEGGYMSSTHNGYQRFFALSINSTRLSPSIQMSPVELGYSVRPVQTKTE